MDRYCDPECSVPHSFCKDVNTCDCERSYQVSCVRHHFDEVSLEHETGRVHWNLSVPESTHSRTCHFNFQLISLQAIFKGARLYECVKKKSSKGEAKNNNLTAENAAARYFPRECLFVNCFSLPKCFSVQICAWFSSVKDNRRLLLVENCATLKSQGVGSPLPPPFVSDFVLHFNSAHHCCLKSLPKQKHFFFSMSPNVSSSFPNASDWCFVVSVALALHSFLLFHVHLQMYIALFCWCYSSLIC